MNLIFSSGPFQPVVFEGMNFYVKRGDLHTTGLGIALDMVPAFTGNKAWKLHYFLVNDFPQVRRLISYGSVQSNMLFSLAVLCQLKGWQLEFYVDHIAGNLQTAPRGNYAAAMDLGAEIKIIPDRGQKLEDYMGQLISSVDESCLFVPEGGRARESEIGIKLLAGEIETWIKQHGLTGARVMLPSGTGTTALYLQKHLSAEVLTCACVGGDRYLSEQFFQLETDKNIHPTILSARKKYHFGVLYPEFLETWLQLRSQMGIEFDFLYDPLGWMTMLDHLQGCSSQAPVIYIHQGGLKGNETMLGRYCRKYPNLMPVQSA